LTTGGAAQIVAETSLMDRIMRKVILIALGALVAPAITKSLTTQRGVEILSAVLEIVAFVLITTDLLGPGSTATFAARMRKRAEAWAASMYGEEESLRIINILKLTCIAIICFALLCFGLYAAQNFMTELPQLHKHWEGCGEKAAPGLECGARPGTFWEALTTTYHPSFLDDLGGVLILLFWGLSILIGLGGFLACSIFVIVLINVRIQRSLFLRDQPERGLLMFGAALFIAAKMLLIVNSLVAIWLGPAESSAH
jgi:hypothetical protein